MRFWVLRLRNYLQQHMPFFATFFLATFFLATFLAGAFLATFFAAFLLLGHSHSSVKSLRACELTDPTVGNSASSPLAICFTALANPCKG